MANGESQVVSGGRVVAINLATKVRPGQVIQRDGQVFVVSGDGLTAVLRSIARNPSQSARVVALAPGPGTPTIALLIGLGLLLLFFSSGSGKGA